MYCKKSNHVEFVFLEGPIWNHSLTMNRICQILYATQEDMKFRKSCSEKILFSTGVKCFFDDPNFRIESVCNVTLFPYKNEITQDRRLIHLPYVKVPPRYRNTDIILKNGYFTTRIPCCVLCGQMKNATLIAMLAAREKGIENRSKNNNANSLACYYYFASSDSIRSSRTSMLKESTKLNRKNTNSNINNNNKKNNNNSNTNSNTNINPTRIKISGISGK